METEKINLNKFLKLYEQLISIINWNKEKEIKRGNLMGYLTSGMYVTISSNRDSRTTKVHAVNEFTIFKVSKKQLGHMKIYRNEWVIMYCYGRHRFTHNLEIVPLEKRVTVKKLKEIKVFRK